MARSKKTAKNMTSEQALSSPETREERFMAKAAGLVASAPETPYTREERYWLAIIDAIAQAGFSPTEAQTAAMNSGITAAILTSILNGLEARPIPTEAQTAAMNSGITAAILTSILNGLEARPIPTEAQTAAMNSGITAAILINILNGLADRPIPTTAQLAAMNSGITAEVLTGILNGLEARPAPPSSNLYLYVSTNGDDDNDGLSNLTPKQTIAGALNAIPKNIGNRNVTIEVANGTYSGNAGIATRFYGSGTVRIVGKGSTIIDHELTFSYCNCRCELENVTISKRLFIQNCTYFTGIKIYSQYVSSSNSAIEIQYTPMVDMYNVNFTSDTIQSCITARSGSYVSVNIATLPSSLSVNNYYLSAITGASIIAYSNLSIPASRIYKERGGVVFVNGSIM